MSSRMRTVSFVEKLELDFEGNLFSQAIALGDVDNDQGNELVVGNIHGVLAIFKGNNCKPWKQCSDLGMITCIGIGDICNKGKNYLVYLSAEGWCDVFEVMSTCQESVTNELQSFHHQHLPPNNKTMLIADIDGDGQTELVIGYSDRCVRTFRWTETTNSDTSKFTPLDSWQLAAQIGGITVNTKDDGSRELMVAQPGGTYVSLISSALSKSHSGLESPGALIEYRSLQGSASRARNVGVTTEIVGGISTPHLTHQQANEKKATNYAVCTLDGTLKLMQNDTILWSLQVDHQLFGLTKLDFTGDGTDEVIVCSWDGHTYIVNHARQVVRFQFEENVAAFCAGNFAQECNINKPCLIYATFSDKICVYHNVSMPQIETTNLLETMDTLPETGTLLSYYNIDPSDSGRLKQLYHWCLYGNEKQTEPSPK